MKVSRRLIRPESPLEPLEDGDNDLQVDRMIFTQRNGAVNFLDSG